MWDRAYGNNLYVLFFLPFWKKWLKNYWHFVTGKTALFVIISDTDATFNFIVSIMYSQLFNLLCDKADDVYNGRSQLKALYKDNASTIEGNCDTTLFLGGKEKDTLKDLAEILGKETIDLYNTSDTRGTSQSYGLNYQKTGKDLIPDVRR